MLDCKKAMLRKRRGFGMAKTPKMPHSSWNLSKISSILIYLNALNALHVVAYASRAQLYFTVRDSIGSFGSALRCEKSFVSGNVGSYISFKCSMNENMVRRQKLPANSIAKAFGHRIAILYTRVPEN
jgi:hypothetical protein